MISLTAITAVLGALVPLIVAYISSRHNLKNIQDWSLAKVLKLLKSLMQF